MELLEREAPLAQLRQLLAQAAGTGQGACVLLYGEAGIGKTALLRQFVAELASGPVSAACHVASCEPLLSPRPLGPLADIAHRLPAALADALDGDRPAAALFPMLLAAFRDASSPVLLAIEDLQWADGATLDCVRFLARRVHELPLLLLLTCRDEAWAADHPLRRLLGELPAPDTTRIALAPLSATAVGTLAAHAGRSGRAVFEATGGNPFYVTEVLASAAPLPPPSVSDAVLGRLAALPPAARAVATCVSIHPHPVAVTALLAVLRSPGGDVLHVDDPLGALDLCVQHGLLQAQGDTVAFRHELARVAVYQSIPPFRRQALHAAALDGSNDADGDQLARHVHHAEGAGLVDAVLRLAPRAARAAAARGAQREAAELYALALRHAPAAANSSTQAQRERALLLEARALACTLAGQHADAIADREAALALRHALGDRHAAGIDQRWLARLHGWGEDMAAAYEHGRQSIALLESVQPPDAELAIAYATFAHLNLLGEHADAVRTWGSKGIALAERVDDASALSHALACVATVRLRGIAEGAPGTAANAAVRARAPMPQSPLARHPPAQSAEDADAEAWQMLERAVTIAVARGLDAEAAFALNMLFVMALAQRRYAQLFGHAERGLALCDARGLDAFVPRIRMRRAHGYLQAGRWSLADADLEAVARERAVLPVMEQVVFDFVCALRDVRRGDPEGVPRLEACAQAMQRHDVRIWFTSVPAARAECAWLRGDAAAARHIAASALADPRVAADPWRAGELAAWCVRASALDGVAASTRLPFTAPVRGPYAQEVAGDPRAAAEAWAAVDGAYDRAIALASGTADDVREAIIAFELMGATPAASVARQRLAQLEGGGNANARIRARSSRPRTRDDPLGLTAREREVFELLLRGLANNDIAAQLHRSARTVEHHVAAVFGKLGTHTRAELIARFVTPASDQPGAGQPGAGQPGAGQRDAAHMPARNLGSPRSPTG